MTRIRVITEDVRELSKKMEAWHVQLEQTMKNVHHELNYVQEWQGETRKKFETNWSELDKEIGLFSFALDSLGHILGAAAFAFERADVSRYIK